MGLCYYVSELETVDRFLPDECAVDCTNQESTHKFGSEAETLKINQMFCT